MPTSFRPQLRGHDVLTRHLPFCEVATHFLVAPNSVIFNMGFFSFIRNVDVAIVFATTLAAISVRVRWHNYVT